MIRKIQGIVLALVPCLTILSAPLWAQSNIEKIKADYQTISVKLEKHLVAGQWIDDDPESPKLLARQWSLAGEWVAAWLNTHPQTGSKGIKAAITELAPSETPECLMLNATTFLVAAPGPIRSVFIITESGGHYKLAWSIAQQQEAKGESAEILAAWQAGHAVHGGRGPYWAASGSAGPVSPQLGMLPSDAEGHARFYIDGWYAQSAGGTVGKQTSLWVWDGATAHPQLARDYAVGLEQKVGTRLEGDLFKVQQKKSFRTFFTTFPEKERQVDWIVRIAPNDMKELGEKIIVPELDAADELFYRLINGKLTAGIASSSAVKTAEKIIGDARVGYSDKDWKQYPMIGELNGWSVTGRKDEKVLCLAIDLGTYLFKLKPAHNDFFIADITEIKKSCHH